MAVDKQNISFSFKNGLDTKTSSDLVTAPVLTELRDCVFSEGGVLKRRKGYTSLPRTWVSNDGTGGSGTVSYGVSINNANDDLILFDGNTAYSYEEPISKWTRLGNYYGTRAEIETTNSGPLIETQYDCCITQQGVMVSVWRDSRGIRLNAIDVKSNNFLLYDVQISATAIKPQCVAFPTGNVVITYVESSNSNFISVVLNTNTLVFSPPSTLFAPPIAVPILYRLVPCAASFAILAINISLIQININKINDQGVLLPGAPLAIPSPAIGGPLILSIQKSQFGDKMYALMGNGTGSPPNIEWSIIGVEFDPVTLTVTRPAIVHRTYAQADGFTPLTLSVSYNSSTNVILFISYAVLTTVGSGTINVTKCESVSVDIPAATAGDLISSQINVIPSADSFYDTIAQTVFCPVYATKEQSIGLVTDSPQRNGTALLLDQNLRVCSRLNINKTLSPVIVDFSVGVAIYYLNKINYYDGRYHGLASSSISPTESALQRVIYTLNVNYQNANTFNTSEFAQACPQLFDGVSFTENGFNEYPYFLGGSVTSGGNVEAGVYNYSYIYQWVDAQNNIHVSAPSEPLNRTVSSNNSKVTLFLKTLNMTEKRNVYIKIYRTLKNDSSAYYLISTVILLNDKVVPFAMFEDTKIDTAIATQEILYTVGGTLPNDPPQSSSVILSAKNRIFYVSDEDKTVRYSKFKNFNYGTSYSDDFFLPQFNGRAEAIANLDSNIIIFDKSKIFAFTGDGPTDTGTQNSFSDIQLVSTDTGTTNQKSVVRVPNGLFYKSDKGLFILDRSLQSSYLGAPVERFNGYSFLSADNIPNTTEVRFVVSGDTRSILNYDYLYDQWGIFNNPLGNNINAISSTVVDNVYYALRNSGEVLKEQPYGTSQATFTDLPTPYIETGWIRVSGLQGFQRFRWIEIFGTCAGANNIVLQVYYDYSTTNQSISTNISINSAGRYQFRIKNRIQKLEAIKIRIEASSSSEISFTGMDFEIGVKSGLRRLPSTNTR